MTHEILTGDCLTIAPSLSQPIAAVVTDPPYGGSFNTNYSRFSGGKAPSKNFHGRNWQSRTWEGIIGDDKPFDPSPWIVYPKVVLFGYQFFAEHLPLGTILVWNKNRPEVLGKYLSDCELAWQKGGYGCYLFNHVWRGFDRASERGQKTLHPSQKPVAVFKWILQRLKLKPGSWVLDPYAGSGACGLACKELDLNYIGIEISEEYAEIARQRLASSP